MAKSERSYQSGASKCWKCKYYFKKFITFLFSHVGLTGLVVGYIILGAIIFRELETGYEKRVKGKVLQNRIKFADLIYSHCRTFSQAQMFAHAMTPCPTMPTTPSSFIANDNDDLFFGTSSSTVLPYHHIIVDDIAASTTTIISPFSNISSSSNNNRSNDEDMRTSNNYGNGDDRFGTFDGAETFSTTSKQPTTTTRRPVSTSTTTASTTSGWGGFQSRQIITTTPSSSSSMPLDRRELQSRVSDAIVDLWQSAEMRQLENVVADNTWDINERFNVLYKRNWTREARRELRQLERRLLQRVYTQIMMSIFGAADLRANELSLDLDDSMITEAPPEASPILMDRTSTTTRTTAAAGRRRQRPVRNVADFFAPKEISTEVDDEIFLPNYSSSQLASHKADQYWLKFFKTHRYQFFKSNNDEEEKQEKIFPQNSFQQQLENDAALDRKNPLPSNRFKRQIPVNPDDKNVGNTITTVRKNSPKVGPPDAAGRRRLSTLNTAKSARKTGLINGNTDNNTANNNNTYNENDIITAVDADDDDDELLFGEEPSGVGGEDLSPPPSRQPPSDIDTNQTTPRDIYAGIRRQKYGDIEDETTLSPTPAPRNETVERLLDILQNQDWLLSDQQESYFNHSVFDLVVHFEHNVSAFILKEGYDGSMDRELWSFSGGLLFSLTVITTIGYGHIAPKTIAGRLTCVVYSLLGIPLMLLCLANIGDAMAVAFKFIYWKICCLYCHYRKRKRRLKRARSTRMRKSPLASALRKQSRKSQETSGSGSTIGRGGDTTEPYPTVAITAAPPSNTIELAETPNMTSYKPSLTGIVTGDRLLAQSATSPSSQPTTTTSVPAASTPSPMGAMMTTTVHKEGEPKRKASEDIKPQMKMPPGIKSAASFMPPVVVETAAVDDKDDEAEAEDEDVEAAELRPLNNNNILQQPHSGSAGVPNGESETEFSTAIVAVNEHDKTTTVPKKLSTTTLGVAAASSSSQMSAEDWGSSERPSSPDLLTNPANEENRRLLTTKETTGPLGERRISVTLSAPLNINKLHAASGGGGGIKKAKKVITIDRAVSEPGELANAQSSTHGGGGTSSPAITTTTANFESWGSLEGENFTERYKRVNVPIWACLLVVVCYLFGGGVMFSQWEGWNVFEGAYFCYISLTTIGFGDIVPGFSAVESDRDAQIKMALCALYLLFGMALLAMSFNLVQENVIDTCKGLARRVGILAEEEDENL